MMLGILNKLVPMHFSDIVNEKRTYFKKKQKKKHVDNSVNT